MVNLLCCTKCGSVNIRTMIPTFFAEQTWRFACNNCFSEFWLDIPVPTSINTADGFKDVFKSYFRSFNSPQILEFEYTNIFMADVNAPWPRRPKLCATCYDVNGHIVTFNGQSALKLARSAVINKYFQAKVYWSRSFSYTRGGKNYLFYQQVPIIKGEVTLITAPCAHHQTKV